MSVYGGRPEVAGRFNVGSGHGPIHHFHRFTDSDFARTAPASGLHTDGAAIDDIEP
jgi:hypothetical protein